MNNNFKSGFVTLIGRPNVGKSTLMNHLIGQKIAITSDKPQTTRNRIQTVYTDERGQVIFLDTPGIHKAKNKLGEYMVKVAKDTLNEVDVVLWLVEPTTYIGAGEEHIIEQLGKVRTTEELKQERKRKTCHSHSKEEAEIFNSRDKSKHISEHKSERYAQNQSSADYGYNRRAPFSKRTADGKDIDVADKRNRYHRNRVATLGADSAKKHVREKYYEHGQEHNDGARCALHEDGLNEASLNSLIVRLECKKHRGNTYNEELQKHEL